jgi:hypothetical protein
MPLAEQPEAQRPTPLAKRPTVMHLVEQQEARQQTLRAKRPTATPQAEQPEPPRPVAEQNS